MALTNFILYALLLNSFNFSISAKLDKANDVHDTQKSIAQCILKITKTYFQEGSIISIATASLRQTTNKKFLINTNAVTLEGIMREMHWNIVIKIAKTHRNLEFVSYINHRQSIKACL